MANPVPLGEALPAMLAMLTVLFFVLVYYCIIPCYRAFQKRKYDREHWYEDLVLICVNASLVIKKS